MSPWVDFGLKLHIIHELWHGNNTLGTGGSWRAGELASWLRGAETLNDLLPLPAFWAFVLFYVAAEWETCHNKPLMPPPKEPLDAPLPGVVGDSPAMGAVYKLTRLVASSRASVLLIGETGTGKEVIARNIHRLSPRQDG